MINIIKKHFALLIMCCSKLFKFWKFGKNKGGTLILLQRTALHRLDNVL